MSRQEMRSLDQRARQLQQDFDRSFAALPEEKIPTEAFLAIHAGGDDYALRLAEISGLYAGRKVTPLPGAVPDLLGLTSFRGMLVPIYDLRILLGYPAGPPPHWLVLMASGTPVGLAFDGFDGHLQVPRDLIAQAARTDDEQQREARQHTVEALCIDGRMRSIISLASILDSINRRAQSRAAQREK